MGIFKKMKSMLGSNDQPTPPPVPPVPPAAQAPPPVPPIPPSVPPIPPPVPPPITPELLQQMNNANERPKDVIQFFIVGTYYRGANAIDRRDALVHGETLRLRKDRRNRHSDTALRVYTMDRVWIGFVDEGHCERIWDDMEGEECYAEFIESYISEDHIYVDNNGNTHVKHYNEDDDYIAYYHIPHFEEKQLAKAKKRKEDAALKDLMTPEGRLEPEDIDYKSLPKEELKKMKESALKKLKGRKKKEGEGEIPESGPIRALYDIQTANLKKTIQLIDEAL